MSPPTAPTSSADFEDQVAAALHRRADPVTADDGARAAIDRRIAHRTRIRRARRVGVAAIAAVVLLAGALALAQRGHHDASVVTVPDPTLPDTTERAAVQLPQLGLPASLEGTHIYDYSPGRSVGIALSATATHAEERPAGVSGPPGFPVGSARVRVTVTDLSPEQVLELNGPQDAVATGTMNGLAVLSRSIDPLFGGSRLGEALWAPAPGVVAALDLAVPSGVVDAGAKAVALAGQLVELDDVAWQSLLNPDSSSEWLGLSGSVGRGEIVSFDPGGGSGLLVQVLDVPGRPVGTYRLSGGPLGGDDADMADTPDVLDHVAVRGTVGLVFSYPRYATTTFPYSESLVWVEGGTRYTLDFTNDSTDVAAAALADQLKVLTSDEWHDLLFPTTLRTDLVPMTDLAATIGTTTTTGG